MKQNMYRGDLARAATTDHIYLRYFAISTNQPICNYRIYLQLAPTHH